MKINITCFKKIFLTIALFGLIAVAGCRPSIHDVIKVVSAIPIGTSRAEMINALAKAYPKYIFPYHSNDLARPLTEAELQACKNIMKVGQKGGGFLDVYPADLFNKIPDKAFSDIFGIIRESTIGGGSFNVFYDSNTNYIGYLAESTR